MSKIEGKNQTPKTILVYKIKNVIEMGCAEFIKLIEVLEKGIVFKTEEYFFVVIEGLIFGTWHFDSYETYREFAMFYNKLEKSELEDPVKILRALILKIDKTKDFNEFLNSNFHEEMNNNYHYLEESYNKYIDRNKGRFEMFLDGKSKGFTNFSDYNQATSCGIPLFEDYMEFKESPFYDRYPDKDDYKDYLMFKSGGFPDRNTFRNAKKYDFNTYSEYKNFKESGCRNKKEFDEYFKVLYHVPDLNEKQFERFLAIIKDTKDAFNNEQYGEYFRLKYIFFEKLIEILYEKLFNKQYEADKLIEEAVKEIVGKIRIKIENYQDLKKWRKIRNKYSHEHYVIDAELAREAKAFFNSFILELLTQVNQYLSTIGK